MISNRPLPPTKLRGVALINAFWDAWTYFSDNISRDDTEPLFTRHGCNVTFNRNSNVWEPMSVDYGGGFCSFLALAFRNTRGSSEEVGFRLFIDDKMALSYERLEIPGQAQAGVTIIGNVFVDPGGELLTIVDEICPFNKSLILQSFTSDAVQIEVLSAARIYYTS